METSTQEAAGKHSSGMNQQTDLDTGQVASRNGEETASVSASKDPQEADSTPSAAFFGLPPSRWQITFSDDYQEADQPEDNLF